jgi:hypothetical protein
MFDAQAIIAEATAEAPKAPENAPEQKAPATPQVPPTETPQDSEEKSERPKEAEDISKKPDSELTPEQLAKREENRKSHARRSQARQQLREENARIKAEIAELKQRLQPTQPKENAAPKLEDFDSLDDWVLATAKHLKQAESKVTEEQNKSSNANAKIEHQRNETLQKIQKFASDVPDYATLVNENDKVLSSFPLQIETAFLEADNAPLALYALMKEDALEDLYDYPPERLAYIIGKAEERGKSYLSPVKKATSAPPPIESLKGTGRSGKSLDDMSVEELMKKFNR